MTKELILKELASTIWDCGETPHGTERLIVGSDFKKEDLAIENILEESCISYTVKWRTIEERGKVVTITLFKNDSYGAGSRVKTIGEFDVKL